jgi:hypothetical protein
MIRYLGTRWVGACLLGTALGTTGCTVSVQRPDAACCGNRFTVPPSGGLARTTRGPTPPSPVRTETGATITTIAPVPAAAAMAPPGSRFPEGPATATGLVADARRRQGAGGRPVLQFEGTSGSPGRGVAQAGYWVPAPGEGLDAPHIPGRRSYVDLTAQPWFGSADDHSWLNGQVLYSRSTKNWRLHYASVDDNDAYGGTVTLLATDELKGLKDGQYVRVCGCPVDPDRREVGAPYRVTSYEVVGHLP